MLDGQVLLERQVGSVGTFLYRYAEQAHRIVTALAAGAAYQGSDKPNAYGIVEIDNDGSARTQVRVWHPVHRWVPDRNAFPPDGWWPAR
jgi:hypothetical protein